MVQTWLIQAARERKRKRVYNKVGTEGESPVM
jgi:hypothetical protein